jgi:hypothetical protein
VAAHRLLLASALLFVFIPASRGHASETVGSQVGFPLAPGTRTTYHLHQEVGPGVRFGPEDAKLAKGNVLDASVQSRVAGSETIGGHSYVRIDSTRDGRSWLSEWYREDAEGLLVAKRTENGQPTVFDPPQKWLSAGLLAGDAWDWSAPDAPVSMHTTVAGEESVSVPAGAFQAVKVSSDLTAQGQIPIRVHQDRWFVRGVGFVKEDTTTTAATHLLSHVVLTLEKFEPPR